MFMDSPSSTSMCPSEDLVQALLEHLVEPVLPLKSSIHEAPSFFQQQKVAKQVHAVALIYNYNQRRCHPKLEFLNFVPFCKLAVILKPALVAHMKLMLRSDYTRIFDLENHISVTEKAIMDACDITTALHEKNSNLNAEGWPISKVAVLLINSSGETCFLQYGFNTHGIWSVIEKDFDISTINSEAVEGKSKHKRKRIIRVPSKQKLNPDETFLQQLAFSAVKEASGIDASELVVLESHNVCSITKEKSAARFYIMQCTQSVNEEIQIPVRNVLKSLQGPLVTRSNESWRVTPVVKYFHVLPYAEVLSDWFSRRFGRCESEEISNNVQDLLVGVGAVTVTNLHCMDMLSKKETIEKEDKYNSSSLRSHIRNKISAFDGESARHYKDVQMSYLCNNVESTHRKDVDDSFVCHTHDEDDSTSTRVATELDCDQKHSLENKSANETHNSNVQTSLCNNVESTHKIDVDDSLVCYMHNEDNNICTHNATELDHDQKNSLEINSANERHHSDAGMSYLFKKVERTHVIDVDHSLVCCSHNEDCGICIHDATELDRGQENFIENNDDSSRIGINLKEVGNSIEKCCGSECECKSSGIVGRICIMSSREDGTLTEVGATSQCNSKYMNKQVAFASNKNGLSETALDVLNRRKTLVNELRDLEAEIALCDNKLQKILNGDDKGLVLNMEVMMGGCNAASQERTKMRVERLRKLKGEGSHQNIKEPSEAVLSLPNPCLVLDDICYKKSWILPAYHVSPSDGAFLANVTLKGVDFEFSTWSEVQECPEKARTSAAAKMVTKLSSIVSQKSAFQDVL